MIELVGHEEARRLLARARPQTVLLTGPEGVGRRALARWYAYGLNCARGFPPCGECLSCRMEPHPDVLEIRPEPGRRPVIPVERIVPREGGGENLLEWIEAAPRFSAKVAIVDGAEHLTESAANAMLKLLEEPPAHAYLVLVAPSPEAVLPTIRSRAFWVPLAPLSEEVLQKLHPDPDFLAFAEGAPGRLFFAVEHPEEVRDLRRLVEDFLHGLADGRAALERARELLRRAEEGLSPWPFFRRAFAQLPPEDRAEALEALSRLEEAHRAYVSRELLAAWWVHAMRSVYGERPSDSL